MFRTARSALCALLMVLPAGANAQPKEEPPPGVPFEPPPLETISEEEFARLAAKQGVAGVRASQDKPPSAKAAPESAGTGDEEPVVIESVMLRDPFWPIGFEPPRAVRQPGSGATDASRLTDWDAAMQLLNVKGVMKTGGGGYVAIVNGQVAGTNDEVSVWLGGATYRWRVRGITERGVSFSRIE
jgi:hypothetical protein